MRVRWTRKAVEALREIADYIAQDSPQAADQVTEHVQEMVGALSHHPSLGRAGRVPGTRELIIPGTPFIVPYRIADEAVEILSVFHAARKWPRQF